MTTALLLGIFLLLLLIALPKVFKLIWFAGLTLLVWAVVIFAVLLVQDVAKHGF